MTDVERILEATREAEKRIIGEIRRIEARMFRIENLVSDLNCSESDMASCLNGLTKKENTDDKQER